MGTWAGHTHPPPHSRGQQFKVPEPLLGRGGWKYDFPNEVPYKLDTSQKGVALSSIAGEVAGSTEVWGKTSPANHSRPAPSFHTLSTYYQSLWPGTHKDFPLANQFLYRVLGWPWHSAQWEGTGEEGVSLWGGVAGTIYQAVRARKVQCYHKGQFSHNPRTPFPMPTPQASLWEWNEIMNWFWEKQRILWEYRMFELNHQILLFLTQGHCSI